MRSTFRRLISKYFFLFVCFKPEELFLPDLFCSKVDNDLHKRVKHSRFFLNMELFRGACTPILFMRK